MTDLVFLTGCGRSGTTILGRALERHPDVTYLNDRFDLWVESLPEADIWGFRGASGGKIELTADDLDRPGMRDGVARLRERIESERGGSRLVIEKLAINNFRLGFLHAAFPDASFVNITRHGVKVAASIAAKIEAGEWYGHSDQKWKLLCAHAEERGLGDVAQGCRNPFERGLLEWRLSLESAARFFESTLDADVAAVRYEHLVREPHMVARGLFGSLGLAIDETACAWADDNISRQSKRTIAFDESRVAELAGNALRALGYGVFPYVESLT